jgi:CHAT domain-containing protein
LLAVGGLDYGKRTAPPPHSDAPALFLQRVTWKPLAGAAAEVERLAGRYRQAFPKQPAAHLLRGDADAARLKRALTPTAGGQRYRYLHLATHAFFEPPAKETKKRRPLEQLVAFGEARQDLTHGRNPMLMSGLVLAGANADAGTGTLTAEEVQGLDLRGCDLAVLSACETGLGKVAGGEGVLGLQRAFQAAGARALVVSLWKVNDAATAVLMDQFYSNLWQKGLTRLEALRQAQLTVLRQPPAWLAQRARELGVRGIEDEPEPIGPVKGQPSIARRCPPLLWAAFVLSGDMGR